MKIIGFNLTQKNTFIHIFANIVIVAVIAVVAGVTLFPSSVPASSGRDSRVIYSGNPNNRNVSLMFDVYSGTEYMGPIFAILTQYNIKASFFVGGTWVRDNVPLLQALINGGQEIGNSGYHNKQQGKLNYNENQEEITSCDDIVLAATGYKMALFMPPGGSYNTATVEVASALNYKVIMWSKNTEDLESSADLIYMRAVSNLKGGDLILLHPTKNTLSALESIIVNILSQGFNIVPVGVNII